MDAERADPHLVGDELQAGCAAVEARDERDRDAERDQRAEHREPRHSSRGTNAASRPTNSGSQIRIESVMSSAQEVEGHAADADDHQRHVVAQEAGLAAAHDRRGGAHDAGRAAGDAAVDDAALHVEPMKRPSALRGAHDDEVDQLVEVPLVVQEGVQRADPRLQPRARARADDPDAVGDRDAGERDQRADDQADPRGPVGRIVGAERRSANVGARNWVTLVVDARDLQDAADHREHRQHGHRELHRPVRARRCGGRGRGSRRRCPRSRRSAG